MRIAVYGAGAIGGLVAARLAQHSADVVLVCRTTRQADTIARDGLRLVTPMDTTVVPVAATTAPAAGTGVALVAVKAYALQSLLDVDAFRDARTVVPLLNGLEHPAELRRALPAVDIRVAAIYVQALRTAADTVEQQSSVARIALGPASPFGDTDPLRAALAAVGFCTDVGAERRVLWEKFTHVCWAATLCSSTGTALGVARAARHDDAAALASELAAVATADGVPTDGAKLLEMMWALPATLEPSMLRDIKAGRPSEIDAITGALVRRARALAVPVPVAERLYVRLRQSNPPVPAQWAT